MMRIWKIWIIGCAVLCVAACGESDETRQQRAKAEQDKLDAADRAALKVGVMPTLDCLPIYLLADSVFYDTTKVDIRLRPFTAQMDCDTALFGGSVEGSVTDLVRVERLRRRGLPLKCVTSTNIHWQLIANKKARLKDLSQFGDKMVAMTRFSATDLLTDKAVKKGKPKYPVYKVQVNDVNIRLHMMQNDEIDAAWMAEPQATAARLAGHNMVTDSQQDSLRLGVVAFRVAVLADDKRDAQVQEFLKAYNRAVDDINKKGVKHYAALIHKYMGMDETVAGKLPDVKYDQVREPLQKDVAAAQQAF